VLVNPLVYASEGMRATLVPQFPHLSITAVICALVFFDVLLLVVGLRLFEKKSVT
jgi:ABC-2 type transport system permease protein